MEVKVGDVVHVRGVVVPGSHWSEPGTLAVDFQQGGEPRWVRPAIIVRVEPAPKPLQVGDQVQHRFNLSRGEIICIADKHLWVRSKVYGLGTYLAEDWERV